MKDRSKLTLCPTISRGISHWLALAPDSSLHVSNGMRSSTLNEWLVSLTDFLNSRLLHHEYLSRYVTDHQTLYKYMDYGIPQLVSSLNIKNMENTRQKQSESVYLPQYWTFLYVKKCPILQCWKVKSRFGSVIQSQSLFPWHQTRKAECKLLIQNIW